MMFNSINTFDIFGLFASISLCLCVEMTINISQNPYLQNECLNY